DIFSCYTHTHTQFSLSIYYLYHTLTHTLLHRQLCSEPNYHPPNTNTNIHRSLILPPLQLDKETRHTLPIFHSTTNRQNRIARQQQTKLSQHQAKQSARAL
ncbi:hypothetical protein SAMD00019534_110180, partial [Acytostelium subglobosum LB1]|uniref:hypothetical protein n=1 Tax=Acytostelium subglobosum LB1 TaxID=1410327 RepID=UPI000644F173